ncbi:MAG TPA: 2-amino-4-hydroxy-6-hydroxymethyldihydropteridine diphosphokinase [Burkholderiales bacterium]|jgi:2-amino-4-hydroxy-6-hydroxymethyldihydropteridine diphosphokinase|nr:2-amino-4-hydroxy-6-hydroxymethyldihydropteridine diphosphokinase [Burkholderiales bacterium]
MSGKEPAAIAFIGLGSNLADPLVQVRQALMELESIPGTRVTARSSLYRTSPAGYLEQPDFINAVASVHTTLKPQALLAALLAIENRHGRTRAMRNAPRTLDLDLLLYGEEVLEEEGLTLPHPRLHERAFVLAPFAEIAPKAMVPGRGRVRDLLARVDCKGVSRIDAA